MLGILWSKCKFKALNHDHLLFTEPAWLLTVKVNMSDVHTGAQLFVSKSCCFLFLLRYVSLNEGPIQTIIIVCMGPSLYSKTTASISSLLKDIVVISRAYIRADTKKPLKSDS